MRRPATPVLSLSKHGWSPPYALRQAQGWVVADGHRASALIETFSRRYDSAAAPNHDREQWPTGNGAALAGGRHLFQPSHSQMASHMISFLSASGIQSISWKCVTHWRQEQGILVMSVPQNRRRGPKASCMMR